MKGLWVVGVLAVGSVLNWAFFVQQTRNLDVPCQQLSTYNEDQLRGYIDHQWDEMRRLNDEYQVAFHDHKPDRKEAIADQIKTVLMRINGTEGEIARRGLLDPDAGDLYSESPRVATRAGSVRRGIGR